MPHGTPSYSVPKSGCRLRVAPQDAMRFAELGSTGSDEISRFHALSAGKTVRPTIGSLPGGEPSSGGSSEPPSAPKQAMIPRSRRKRDGLIAGKTTLGPLAQRRSSMDN